MNISLNGLPNIPLRNLVAVMFILVAWATVFPGVPWIGLSYILTNFVVLQLGLWGEIDHASPVPVQFFFFGVLFTVLNDIISLGVSFSDADDIYARGHLRSNFQFNAAMAIILVLVKPLICLFVYKEWQERVGGIGQEDSNYERLGGNQGGYPQGGYGGVFNSGKTDTPPQYQPPHGQQPFP